MLEFRRVLLDRKSTRLNSSHTIISYAVFCLKKTKSHASGTSSPHVPLLLTLVWCDTCNVLERGTDGVAFYEVTPTQAFLFGVFFLFGFACLAKWTIVYRTVAPLS